MGKRHADAEFDMKEAQRQELQRQAEIARKSYLEALLKQAGK